MDSEFERRRRSEVELMEFERHRPQNRLRPSKPARGNERYRAHYEVGALLRRQFRAELDYRNVSYIEHKGWLDSSFVVTGTLGQIRALDQWGIETGYDDD